MPESQIKIGKIREAMVEFVKKQKEGAQFKNKDYRCRRANCWRNKRFGDGVEFSFPL